MTLNCWFLVVGGGDEKSVCVCMCERGFNETRTRKLSTLNQIKEDESMYFRANRNDERPLIAIRLS